jgi:hypothetical protein
MTWTKCQSTVRCSTALSGWFEPRRSLEFPAVKPEFVKRLGLMDRWQTSMQ